MKLIGLILVIQFIFFGCSIKHNKYYLERSNKSKKELLQIDKKNGFFYYHVNHLNEKFEVSGKAIYDKEYKFFELIFPINSEVKKLAPFEKSSLKITKLANLDSIELNINQYDMGLKMSGIIKNFEIISKSDSTTIESHFSNTITIEKKHENQLIKFGGFLTHPVYMEIPKKGKYSIEVRLQENSNVASYASTSGGCYPIYSNPKKYLRICKNDTKKPSKMSFSTDCEDPFKIIEIK